MVRITRLRAGLARPNLHRRRGCDGEGASRKATAPLGINGQSTPAGIGNVQLGAGWSVCFGDGH